jgi:MerR family transcriptional regulator, light-induced transcriptional regulator
MAPQIARVFDPDAFASICERDPVPRANLYSGYDPSREAADRRRADLMKTIELDIIPKMISARREVQSRSSGNGFESIFRVTAASVAQFTRLLRAEDISASLAYIESPLSQGFPLETIYLDLLAASAHHLGALWDEDLIDFAEVTVGLGRLQQIVRELDQRSPCEVRFPTASRRVLIVPVRGNQHTFGSLMVGEFLRRAGWDVWSVTPDSDDKLTNLLRENWFAIVGFSVSCDSQFEALSTQIRQTREVSRNRQIGIMVGGPVFAAAPQLAAKLGADATALDAGQAAGVARSLVSRSSG